MGRHRSDSPNSGNPRQGPGAHVDTDRQPGDTARADRTPDDHFDNPGRNTDDPDMGAR